MSVFGVVKWYSKGRNAYQTLGSSLLNELQHAGGLPEPLGADGRSRKGIPPGGPGSVNRRTL
jgi:hypothetical protein